MSIQIKDIKFSHDEYSQRQTKHFDKKIKKIIRISIFGGSSTYDLGVSDNNTWVQKLQNNLV